MCEKLRLTLNHQQKDRTQMTRERRVIPSRRRTTTTTKSDDKTIKRRAPVVIEISDDEDAEERTRQRKEQEEQLQQNEREANEQLELMMEKLNQLRIEGFTDKNQFDRQQVDQLKQLSQQRTELERMQKLISEMQSLQLQEGASTSTTPYTTSQDDIVRFNVEGEIFNTTRHTLLQYKDSLFELMLKEEFPLDLDDTGAIIVQRSKTYFNTILEYLRYGNLAFVTLPGNRKGVESVLHEAEFYNLSLLVAELKLTLQQMETGVETLFEKFSKIVYRNMDIQRRQHYNLERCEKLYRELQLEEDSKKAQREFHEQKQAQIEEYIQKEMELVEKSKQEAQLVLQNINKQQKITFNVAGQLFEMDCTVLASYPKSLLFHIMSVHLDKLDQPIFIDRSPTEFKYIKEFMETGKVGHSWRNTPKNISRIIDSSKFYQLEELAEYVSPTRYPLDDLGEENIQMREEESLVRRMFVDDRNNPILDDPYLLLVNVFDSLETFEKKEPENNLPLLFDFEAKNDYITRPKTHPPNIVQSYVIITCLTQI
jgi:flagellar motor protein MotB